MAALFFSMLRSLTYLWPWLKRRFFEQSPSAELVNKPLVSEPDDSDYHSCLFALIEEAEQGKSWGRLQSILIHRGISEANLTIWLKHSSEQWLAQPEDYQGLAKQLQYLGQVAGSSLGSVAIDIGQRLQIDKTEVAAATESVAPISHSLQDQIDTSLDAKDFQRALSLLDKKLQLEANDFAALTNRGTVLRILGHHEKAIENFKQAIQLNSDNYISWLNYGLTLVELGDHKAAIECFDQTIFLSPDESLAWSARGKSQFNLGLYEAAAESYKHLTLLNSDDPASWHLYSSVLNMLGHHEEAIKGYDQALHLEPNSVTAWLLRGMSLSELGQHQAAVENFEKAIQLDPENFSSWLHRGMSSDRLGCEERAIESYDQALQLKPNEHVVWFSRGASLDYIGKCEMAIGSHEQFLKLMPEDAKAWYNRGVSLKRLGCPEKAIESYDQAIKLQHNMFEVWQNRGDALEDLLSCEEAILNCDQALYLNPESHVAWRNRGNSAYVSIGYRPEVQSMFVPSMQLKITNSAQRLLNTWRDSDVESLTQSLELSFANSAKHLQETAPHLPQTLSKGISPILRQFLQQSTNLKSLFAFLSQPPSVELIHQLEKAQQNHHYQTNPDLNQRGYKGALASYRAELDKAIRKDSHPKGWAFLHQAIGRIQVVEAGKRPRPYALWQQAATSFKTALTAPNLALIDPQLYLDILQSLIHLSINLDEQQTAIELQRQGRDLITRLINDPDLLPNNSDLPVSQRPKFALIAGRFDQLSVDSFIQVQQPSKALMTAEAGKRLCLRWLLSLDEVPPVDLQQIKLSATQAIVYWHLSPSRLTTFVLLPGDSTPHIVPTVGGGDNELPAWLQQRNEWDTWLKRWNKSYREYIGLGKQTSKAREQHVWRRDMFEELRQLRVLLNIDAVAAQLAAFNITELWLMPHRDLHRLPIHGFFSDYTCTYLPHLPICRPVSEDKPLQLISMLIVENPKHQRNHLLGKGKTLAELPFAEVEAECLRQLLAPQQSHTLTEHEATKAQLEKAIVSDYRMLHFCGHGVYNSHQPAQSCLFLSGTDRLTLLDIVQQDLSQYALITLAACETAITGNETITDEYVGLVSACLSAGARYVLSTLWRVESEASMVLMIEFYRNLQQGMPPATALKQAQFFLAHAARSTLSDWFTEVLKLVTVPAIQPLLRSRQAKFSEPGPEYPFNHPYYWAPFTITTA